MKQITLRGIVASLVIAAATLAVLFAADSGGRANAQVSGGPVVLMGIDAEDGGVDGHGPITVYEAVVNSILGEVTNGGSGILVIGGGKAADDVGAFWSAIDAAIPAHSVTFVNGAGAIGTQSFAGFAMIGVVSTVAETPSGGLTQAENDALAARVGDVASFINGGGGLLGFSQSGFTNPYAYIGGLGAFSVNIDLGYSDITPTADGSAIGITDALDICCWHDTYLTFPSFLNVLATNNDPADDGFGEPAAIGGAQVIILPEGPFGDPTCSDGIDNDADGLTDGADPDCAPPPTIDLAPATDTNNTGTSHTVTATLTQSGNPVAGVAVTFSVTAGPNAGQTGQGTTNASGQATFTYTGSSTAGSDTIQACFLDQQEQQHCDTASKAWVVPPPPPPPPPQAVVQQPAALPATGRPSAGSSGLPWLALAIGAFALASAASAAGLALGYQRRRIR